MAHKVYEVEFKQMIVGLLESGIPAREVSSDYSLNEGMIRRWRREFNQRGGDFTKVAPISPREEELKALKKELRDVKMERDILKKAVHIFSRSDR